MMNIIENTGIDAQANEGNHDKLTVLNQYTRIIIVKCPGTVYEIISGGRDGKAHGVWQILMGLQYLFKKISNPEIDDHADKAGNAET